MSTAGPADVAGAADDVASLCWVSEAVQEVAAPMTTASRSAMANLDRAIIRR
ncbi:hypothetical protein MPY17_27145 [Rhodococcus opacus]|uniref:hypothetical protein n=1 Tax=Rhodococcus opacus TaxID=37919 RepID=UPI001FF3B338|nr:hypothetical protein [Rhodococcus opacus]UOT02617.1 hypothetical protein MPY17_27145 [Rhodococcus opacus]